MNVKKAVIIVVTGFAAFFVFSAPAAAAAMVKETAELAWNLMSDAATSLQTFMTTLIQ